MGENGSHTNRSQNWLIGKKNGIKAGCKDAPYMSRREFMDFAIWLKYHVSEEEFAPDIVTSWDNGRQETMDRNKRRRVMLHRIKGTRLPELYQGLSILLRHHFDDELLASQRDCETLFEIPIFFEEDLYAALILYGLDEKRAREFASMSASGAYKAYSRSVDSWSRISMIHGDFENFCRAAGGLPNRRMLTRIFPEQYKRFLSETKQKKA